MSTLTSVFLCIYIRPPAYLTRADRRRGRHEEDCPSRLVFIAVVVENVMYAKADERALLKNCDFPPPRYTLCLSESKLAIQRAPKNTPRSDLLWRMLR